MTLLNYSVDAFVRLLRDNGISSFYLVTDSETGKFRASHPALQELADFFANENSDYDGHEGVFGQIGPKSGVLQAYFA